MSMVTIGKNGRVYQRKFDHDFARELRAEGMTYQQLADHFSVSVTALEIVFNAKIRTRNRAGTARRNRELREPCLGGCGALVWRHGAQGRARTGYCPACSGLRRATTVRETTLRCSLCGEWKPDEAFPLQRAAKARRARAGDCRSCQTIRRREHRKRQAAGSP
jgi:hypothetical protein